MSGCCGRLKSHTKNGYLVRANTSSGSMRTSNRARRGLGHGHEERAAARRCG
ncbi:hypothetical protein ACFOPN_09350 [Xanthomonas hyacinthi]|uniref:hypothetical protein n=1 Tax=Xanthomonas hyacinthi TaxID=56455 RepID=UPI000A6D6BE9